LRVPIIAGNWKMHKTGREAAELARQIVERIGDRRGVEVVLCPPFTALAAVAAAIEGSDVKLGAQNVHWEHEGAFTGEISPRMLLETGCAYVIVGHSERRTHFGESDQMVNWRARAALANGLNPIICVGETLEQRRAGTTVEVVTGQVRKALEGISRDEIERVVLAYEPLWAIGSGLPATPADADEVARFIRKVVSDLYDAAAGDRIRIQYGGSVKPDNIGGFMQAENIDGALVGGASLDAESFAAIVRYEP